MDNFRIIYKILSILEKNLDYASFDAENIAPETLGITKQRRDALLIQLVKSGYVEGESYKCYIDEAYPRITDMSCIMITLSGLEYLSENSLMKKAMETIKNVIPIVK